MSDISELLSSPHNPYTESLPMSMRHRHARDVRRMSDGMLSHLYQTVLMELAWRVAGWGNDMQIPSDEVLFEAIRRVLKLTEKSLRSVD